MTKQYRFSEKLVVLIGPNKSICSSSSGLLVLTKFFDLKELFSCLPCKKAEHLMPDLKDNFGRPRTKSCLTILVMVYKEACPSFLCQSHLSSSDDTRHVTF